MAADDTKALFFERDLCALTPLDADRARSFLVDLIERAREDELSVVAALLETQKASAFLSAVLDLSPFIREALTRHPSILSRIVSASPESALHDILTAVSLCGMEEGASEASLMTDLRRFKREAHVLIAL